LILELIEPGDCVIDVGANIGYYLLMFRRKVGDTGRVICIEPEPSNLRELYHCMESNRFNNVEIIRAAVGEVNGTALLQPGFNGRISSGEFDEGSGINVPVITLDQLASRRPALIKIDIEGFEGQALLGMQRLLRTQSPTLFIEIHPHLMTYGVSVREVVQMVRPHYREICFWEAVHGGSRVQRLAMRYISTRAIRELRTAERLVRECEQGIRNTTFWMICKN
jgi:FkbM family methyltransferase